MEYRLTIKDLPEEERPRERLWKYGAEILSNVELLAIIIRTGSKEETALSLAQRLLTQMGEGQGINSLLDVSVEELSTLKGISMAKACQIKASVELGRRLGGRKAVARFSIKFPQDVAQFLMEEMRYLKKEFFKVVQLNVKNQVISVDDVSIGGINAAVVHPREIFYNAIRRGSAAIVLVHNHPSGDPTPSQEDIQVTRRISEAGRLLGIEVLDHIVIGDGIFISMKEKSIL